MRRSRSPAGGSRSKSTAPQKAVSRRPAAVPLASLTVPLASLSSDDVKIVEGALVERKAVLRRELETEERLEAITVFQKPSFTEFSQTGPAKWLLLVAIDKYNDPQIANASGVAQDAARWKDVAATHCGFDKIVELANSSATRSAILSRLEEVAALAKAGDDFLFVFLGLGGQSSEKHEPVSDDFLFAGQSSEKHEPVLCCADVACSRAVKEDCQIALSTLASHMAAIGLKGCHCTAILDCNFSVSRLVLEHKRLHRGAAPSWSGRHVKRAPNVASRSFSLNSPIRKPAATDSAPTVRRDFSTDAVLRKQISRLEAFCGNEKQAGRFLEALSTVSESSSWPSTVSESQLPLFIDSIASELLGLHHIDVLRSGRTLHRRMDLHACDKEQPNLTLGTCFSALEGSAYTLFCASDLAVDACEVVDATGPHGALSLSLCDAIEAAVEEEHCNGLRSSWKDIYQASIDWHSTVRITSTPLFVNQGCADRCFFGPPIKPSCPITISNCTLNTQTLQIELFGEADNLKLGQTVCIGTESGADLMCVNDVLPSVTRFVNERKLLVQLPAQQSGSCWIVREVAKATVVEIAAGVAVLQVCEICPPFPKRSTPEGTAQYKLALVYLMLNTFDPSGPNYSSLAHFLFGETSIPKDSRIDPARLVHLEEWWMSRLEACLTGGAEALDPLASVAPDPLAELAIPEDAVERLQQVQRLLATSTIVSPAPRRDSPQTATSKRLTSGSKRAPSAKPEPELDALDAGALWLSIQRLMASDTASPSSGRQLADPRPPNSLIELLFVRLVLTNHSDPKMLPNEQHILTLFSTLRATAT